MLKQMLDCYTIEIFQVLNLAVNLTVIYIYVVWFTKFSFSLPEITDFDFSLQYK